jgi:hypothetical protein
MEIRERDFMETTREGLRIRVEPGIHPEVRRACLEFAKWIRTMYNFPIRVVVYIKKSYQIKTLYTKEMVSASFLGPYDKTLEPYIRVSTGDYLELIEELGKDNALFCILGSIAHELGHYYQWLDDEELDAEEAEEGADYFRFEVLDMYAETREHP